MSVAVSVLERLRESVEKANISAGENGPNLTVSIGLTELTTENARGVQALDQAISRADEALYQAKETSRNRLCVV